MKKPKHWSQPTTRIHQSREDRARTWAGKTADSKVRSEARHLVALQHSSEAQHTYQATAAKTEIQSATAEHSETAEAARPQANRRG
jgi:hypothetical protein